MVNGIVTVFVVLAIFAVVASLLTLYVWRADPYQFAIWTAALRARREGRDVSTPQSASSAWPGARKPRARSFGGLRRGVVSGPAAPVATTPPITTPGKSAAARLQFWLEPGAN
jgi:hypothetical protein